jgi:LEA14-like dessication related protein
MRGKGMRTELLHEKDTKETNEELGVAAFLLIVLVVVAVVIYGYYLTHPTGTQRILIGNLQLRSTSVDITSLPSRTGLSIDLKAVVYNPNEFGGTMDTAEYSVYANGHYLGSGKTTREYDLTPQSSQTLTFPITVGWSGAFETMGSYVLDSGHVTWMVNGTTSINVGGLSISGSFEFTTG